MESLRRYIADQTELELYLGTLSSFDNKELIRAERDIDKLIGNFYQGENRPAVYNTTQVYTAVLTTTTATIAGLSPNNDGYFDYCTIEIISGSKKGKRIAISSQSGSTLTFFDTQSGLSETSKVKIFQEGKFPRVADTETDGGVYYKTIPEFLKEAVALQYSYRIAEGDNLNTEQVQSGYSVSRDSYSENFDNSKTKSIEQRISPQAYDILADRGLTITTI